MTGKRLVLIGLFVCVALAAGVSAPGAAATPENATTPDNGTISEEQARDLINQSETWTSEQATNVYDWLATNDPRDLTVAERERLFRRLLERTVTGEVPDQALQTTADALPTNRTRAIASDVAAEIPDADAQQLADQLGTLGGSLQSALEGVLAGEDNVTRDDGAGTIADARAARFVVRQPHYIDSEVRETADNGTPVYEVRGEEITLHPESFATENVVDFSVAPTGDLTLDRELGVFTLRPPAQGTYTLTFVVQRATATPNGTETVAVRYAARIRVIGGTNLTHRPQAERADVQQAAERWQSFNASIQQAGYVDPGETTDEVVQNMINFYELKEDPVAFFTGNPLAILLTIVFGGVSGVLVYLFLTGPWAILMALARKQARRFEIIEAEEGTARDAQAAAEFRDRLQLPETATPADILNDQEAAAAIAEAFAPDDDAVGTTMGDVGEGLLNDALPRTILTNYLNIGGANGWTARPRDTGAVATDGGQPALELVRLERLDDKRDPSKEDNDLVDLTAISVAQTELLERFDWREPLRKITLDESTEIPASVTESPDFDLEQMAHKYEVDLRHFDDPAEFGEAFEEIVAWVVEHATITDGDGVPDNTEYLLGRLHHIAQYMDDYANWPMLYLRQAIRAGRLANDRGDELDDAVQDLIDARPGPGGDDE